MYKHPSAATHPLLYHLPFACRLSSSSTKEEEEEVEGAARPLLSPLLLLVPPPEDQSNEDLATAVDRPVWGELNSLSSLTVLPPARRAVPAAVPRKGQAAAAAEAAAAA
jgi:hypothetical protein